MKRFLKLNLTMIMIIVLLFSSTAYADVYVKGYFKSNGTYVEPYFRTSPNNTINDNYSTYPNINPYTGKQGTIMSSYYSNQAYSSFYNSYYVDKSIIKFSITTLERPSFPVYINDYNVNNTDSKYYPTILNGVVFIPLTAEMISVMKLSGGWDSTNGMVLKTSDISPSSNFSTASTNITTAKNIVKPTYPVIVNDVNLNVVNSEYYPVVINDVVYIPLSSEFHSKIRLSGGWHESFVALYSY
nr:hypothetical protein [uncultured Aminipila sp.]